MCRSPLNFLFLFPFLLCGFSCLAATQEKDINSDASFTQSLDAIFKLDNSSEREVPPPENGMDDHKLMIMSVVVFLNVIGLVYLFMHFNSIPSESLGRNLIDQS